MNNSEKAGFDFKLGDVVRIVDYKDDEEPGVNGCMGVVVHPSANTTYFVRIKITEGPLDGKFYLFMPSEIVKI